MDENKTYSMRSARLWKLFLSTLYISSFTFGGGFVIVTFMKKKFVDELHWIDEQEMLDMTALAQSSPGAIAVNAAILVGWQVEGLVGMLVAVLGTIIPPMVILSVVSVFYNAFASNHYIALLLKGMQAGVAAAFLNNSLTDNQKALMLHRAREGWYKIIYVAPERLEMPGFQRFAQEKLISMVTVDEAHCISQWGQDFRPSYLRIKEFVGSLPSRPVVGAFTATATARVRDDIRSHLDLHQPYEVTTGFDRPNLYFETRRALPSQKPKELLDLVLREGDNAGIVYCSTTKQVDETARLLQSRGIRAAAYHAKLDAEVRRKNQDDFLYDRVQIMVATNAFGMGIDKPNVRFVIHYNMPKDLESYYQEAGRAGRDGLPSRCILLYSGTDVRTIRFFIDKEMEADNGLPADVKAEAARKAEERLKYMTFYSTTQKCLRRFMLNYFGEAAPEKCGNCSCCLFAEQNAQEVEERAAAAKQRAAANSRRLSARRAAANTDLSEADEKLLAALYALRKRLAAKQNVPAYMVFSDATLREMVQSKPLSMDEFLNITGVGEKKAARYGMAFLRVIEEMVNSR